MARAKAPCGTYTAYKRHLREKTPVDAACRKAQKAHDSSRSTSAVARQRRAAEKKAPVKRATPVKRKPPAAPPEVPTTAEGHVSRLEVLKELLETSRKTIAALADDEPARVYLLMREQREILREISELQGNGQVKGVTLVDQLAEARARRRAEAAAAASS